MKIKNTIVAILLIASLSLVTASAVFARAGGGEDYVSSDSGSSAGGSSYSGSSGFYYGGGSPIIVIIVLIGYAVFKHYSKKAQGGILGTGAPAVDFSVAIAAIKQKDPSFDEQNFKDKANTTFYKIQYAWEKKDMDIARAFVTDSIMQRYSVQLQGLKDKHQTNKMENMTVGSTVIAAVSGDEKFDKITVRFEASAADYTVDDATGNLVKGSKTPSHFTEYWTFLRSKAAHTDATKSLKDNKCPNCGAALEVNATGKCNYCGSVLTSGEYDWVLSEITQKGDFERANGGQNPLSGGGDVGKVVGNVVTGMVISGILSSLRKRR